MKELTYCVCFVIFFAKGLSDNNIGYRDKYDNQKGYQDYDNQFYVDNPDNYEEIVRPCQVYDIDCIRRFFADHSKCQIRNGPIPDSVTLPQTIYLARINTSLISTDRISGLNSTRVEEFYYNKATNNIVFAIQIRNYGRVTENGYVVVYRRGREPVVAVSRSDFLLDSLTITSIIPFKDYIDLENAEITTYFDNPRPQFSFGPELTNNPDPALVAALAAQMNDIFTDTQEDFLTTTLPLPIFYIQTNICDFGLKIPFTT